jgi:hypothetical protein
VIYEIDFKGSTITKVDSVQIDDRAYERITITYDGIEEQYDGDKRPELNFND